MICGQGDDRARGAVGDDTIDRDAGYERPPDGGGADLITGGDGNDILDGEVCNDVLFGGAGNTILRGTEGSDEHSDGGGNDILRALSGAQVVDGGRAFDTPALADKCFGSGTSGVHIDLTADFDNCDQIDTYARFGAIVTSVDLS